jgi:tetratricopeptide (TPR) repeat protein
MKFREFVIKKINPDPEKFRNRMERMAGKNVIFNSDLYHAGIKQFDDNLNAILELFHNQNTPVFLGNIISNEKDQMPFESQTVIPHNDDEWYNQYVSALESLKIEDKNKAYNALVKVNRIDSTYATAQFFQARLAYEKGNYDEAKRCFLNAKELDIVRFRAPEQINSVIEQASKKHKSYLVDVKKAYEEISPNGIIGKELVLEHLHPNIDGYFLIAECFFKALNSSELIKSEYQEHSFAKIRYQYPITPVDSFRGLYEVYMLRESWPFNESIPDSVTSKGSYIEQIAGGLSVKQFLWNQAMTMLEEYYIKNHDKVGQLRVNEAFALEFNFDPQFPIKAGNLSDELGDYERAAFYYKKAFHLNPSFENAKRTFLAFLKNDQPESTLTYIDYAISNNTGKYDMIAFKELVLKVIDLKKSLQKSPHENTIIKEIITAYQTLGNETGAQKYFTLTKTTH